jgi:hypothetical protein
LTCSLCDPVLDHGHGLFLCLDCPSRARDHDLGLEEGSYRDGLNRPTFDGCQAAWSDADRSWWICYLNVL